MAKPSWYVTKRTSHSHPWVGAVSASESWSLNMWCMMH